MRISATHDSIVVYADSHEVQHLLDRRYSVDYDGDHVMVEEGTSGACFRENKGRYEMHMSVGGMSALMRFGPIEIDHLVGLLELPPVHDRPLPGTVKVDCETFDCPEMFVKSVEIRMMSAMGSGMTCSAAVDHVRKLVCKSVPHGTFTTAMKNCGVSWTRGVGFRMEGIAA